MNDAENERNRKKMMIGYTKIFLFWTQCRLLFHEKYYMKKKKDCRNDVMCRCKSRLDR